MIQTSHTPAHDVTATVAPFRAWRGSQLIIAGGPERTTIAERRIIERRTAIVKGYFYICINTAVSRYGGIGARGSAGRNQTDTDRDQVPRLTTIVECNCLWIPSAKRAYYYAARAYYDAARACYDAARAYYDAAMKETLFERPIRFKTVTVKDGNHYDRRLQVPPHG